MLSTCLIFFQRFEIRMKAHKPELKTLTHFLGLADTGAADYQALVFDAGEGGERFYFTEEGGFLLG